MAIIFCMFFFIVACSGQINMHGSTAEENHSVNCEIQEIQLYYIKQKQRKHADWVAFYMPYILFVIIISSSIIIIIYVYSCIVNAGEIKLK